MSLRYKGGVISATPPTTTGGENGTAPGVWTLEQQMQAQAAGTWPLYVPFGAAMRSLRFNSADSAYLNRTPASAGNRKTWTWSAWVKRSALGSDQIMFECYNGASNNQTFNISFASSGSGADSLSLGAYSVYWRQTTAQYRDVSAWYHIVVAVDTTQATASNRIKVYVNGSQITNFATSNDPSLNDDLSINQAAPHYISGRQYTGAGYYFNGYMTEIVLVDGQALTPSSFGQTNSTTGVWEPKAITGLTYGTNGFYLKFQDNSGTTSTTLGKDSSGNGNNWTPNNFSVTAGVGNDSLVDTPYPYGTDTGAGGEVRGNYCTLNALRQATGAGASLANGNLQFTCITSSTGSQTTFATMGITTGKWYFEMNVTTTAGASPTYYPGIGVNTDLALAVTSQSGDAASGYMFLRNGQKYNSGSLTNYGNAYVNNDVVGVAIDMDAGKIWFSINGTYQNSGSPTGGTNEAFSGITGTAIPCVIGVSNAAGYLNFGQRPFAYTAPSGFKALVTQNLPTPATVQPDDYFNTVLYTGNGNTGRSITGVGFQPDFVWNKARSAAYSNRLADAVRGATKLLNTDSTGAEFTDTQSITAFNSDGFTVGNSFDNTNAVTYVAWNWKANGAGSSNTAGTITSTVSANTTSGFSIVRYTGNGTSGATVGHGLGAVPQMIIFKLNQNGISWNIYHVSLGNQRVLYFATDAQSGTSALYFNNTTPSSTVFTLGSGYDVNNNGSTIFAYCFAPVAGYSAFGSYTGNGSSDGPFIYTGFRPKYVLIKSSSTGGAAYDWEIRDTVRSPYNVDTTVLVANSANSESSYTSGYDLDILSNGFKLRSAGAVQNANTVTYIYAAFAENPFKYALAR